MMIMKPTVPFLKSAFLALGFVIPYTSIQTFLHADAPCSDSNPNAFYGTLEPFASEAIYFLLLDRFVDGDPSNNHEDQGGAFPTWDQKLIGPDGQEANIGYLGGDFQGIVNNLDYIREMGFTAIWTTPIMDNPDEHFSGGEAIEFGGAFRDGGKTGYHGYWASNYFVEDEHWVSPKLDFETYANTLHDNGFKVVFDIVTNHGSPSFSMPVDQPKFGELYDGQGNLVADHQNLHPSELDASNALHAFFHPYEDILQLSNLDDTHPDVMQYFIDAYLGWIEKGADAFRIDTIRHVPHRFWKQFADTIRSYHPGFYMFGESYAYDANFIAQHTLPKNGGVSVLDFPGRAAMIEVFEAPDKGFEELDAYLHLTHGPYTNPYDLVTFYDNHDMERMNASDEGFINAHNWLFTSRGIPCVYYGSEMGFMRGTAEHAGNRNYFGQERIDQATHHPIRRELARIAHIRKKLVALQRGIQVNVKLEGQTAVFYRVYYHDEIQQTVLVLLNKGDTPIEEEVTEMLQPGLWTNIETGQTQHTSTNLGLKATVPANSFSIWVHHGSLRQPDLIEQLRYAMQHR